MITPVSETNNGELMPHIRIGRLTTTDGILTELRSLYRAARRGEMQAGEATKLTYILKVMSEIMTLREMEKRLDCLESGTIYRPEITDGNTIDAQETH